MLYFGHQLQASQWGGVGLVFAGLGLELWGKYNHKQKGQVRDVKGIDDVVTMTTGDGVSGTGGVREGDGHKKSD